MLHLEDYSEQNNLKNRETREGIEEICGKQAVNEQRGAPL